MFNDNTKKSKLISNPFVMYTISFGVVFLVYSLKWSNGYPDLSANLLLFFGITMVIMLLIGFVFHRVNYFCFRAIDFDITWIKKSVIFCLILFVIECVYARTVPLYSYLTTRNFDYFNFGLPYIHVIFVNYLSFLSIYIFHCLLSTDKKNRKKLLIYLTISLSYGVLIMSRGMAMTIFIGYGFVFLMYIPYQKLKKKILLLTIITISILYLFGVLGNIRSVDSDRKNYILNVTEASDNFRESIIPNEFYWSYLYIATPIGNVQYEIDNSENRKYSFSDLTNLVVQEFLPEMFSKRISAFTGLEKRYPSMPFPHINASSVYGGSFANFGWFGVILMFMFTIFFLLVNLILIPRNSPFFITGVVILLSIILLNIFANMFNFMGMVTQLIFPIIFSLKFLKRKSANVLS